MNERTPDSAGPSLTTVDHLWALVRQEMAAYRRSRDEGSPDSERLKWHAANVESLALHIRVLGNHGLADTCDCYARRIRADVDKYAGGQGRQEGAVSGPKTSRRVLRSLLDAMWGRVDNDQAHPVSGVGSKRH